MSGWWEVLLALALFLASHALPARPGLRAALIERLGRGLYFSLYGLVSLVLLAWLILAVARAPYLELWPPAAWQLWVPFLVMPLACLLMALGFWAPNPLSLGGRERGFDPERPGIAGITRHPLLWAIALWAGAHLVANGDLAHLLLFGVFLVFALHGAAAIDRRRRAALGEAQWAALSAHAPFVPFGRLAAPRLAGWTILPLALRLLAALVLFMALLHLHQPVIGVSPLPLELAGG